MSLPSNSRKNHGQNIQKLSLVLPLIGEWSGWRKNVCYSRRFPASVCLCKIKYMTMAVRYFLSLGQCFGAGFDIQSV